MCLLLLCCWLSPCMTTTVMHKTGVKGGQAHPRLRLDSSHRGTRCGFSATTQTPGGVCQSFIFPWPYCHLPLSKLYHTKWINLSLWTLEPGPFMSFCFWPSLSTYIICLWFEACLRSADHSLKVSNQDQGGRMNQILAIGLPTILTRHPPHFDCSL